MLISQAFQKHLPHSGGGIHSKPQNFETYLSLTKAKSCENLKCPEKGF